MRSLAVPPGWVFAGVVAATGALTLWSYSGGSTYALLVFILLLWVWAALGVVWLVRAAAAVTTGASASWLRWLGVPALVVVIAVTAVSGLPRQLRFEASQAELERAARTVRATGEADYTERRLGWMTIEGIEPIPGGARLSLPGLSWSYALAWHPGGPPAAEECWRYEHYDDDWYDATFCD